MKDQLRGETLFRGPELVGRYAIDKSVMQSGVDLLV